jgi:NADH-quinone oxidoreductase subunit L
MTWPMIVLAVGSVFCGGLLAFGGMLQHWLEPVVGAHEEAANAIPVWVRIGGVQFGPVTAVTLAVIAVGIAVAYRMYGARPVPAEAPAGSVLTVAARRDLYGDAFNEGVFMRPGALLTRDLVEVDDKGIDGSVTGLARAIGRLSGALRLTETGYARSYALSMLAGAALVAAAMILAVRMW